MSNGDAIYYLSGDTVRMVTMPDSKKATVVFEVPKETATETYQITGLSCGPDNTLAFNLVHSLKNVTDFSKPISRVTIESFNPISKIFRTLMDDGETLVRFPSVSYDGSLLAMSASDYKHEGLFFIIKDLKSGSVKRYDQLKSCNLLHSLSPDNKFLAITGIDDNTKSVRMFMFDLEKLELNPWLEGQTPLFSPNGKMIAYTTNKQQKLIIADRAGKMIQSYDRYFVKDLNGWIDNNRIVFTIGHFMYKNHIGILDLDKKRLYDVEVPTSGEISGICYRPREDNNTNSN